jgi:predicted transposase YbfD/YdcC
VIGAWLADRDRADQHQRRREVAVDAKTLRGARQDGRRIPDRGGPRHPRRIEPRTLKAVSVGGFGFPHTAQVVQVSRKVRDRRSPGRRWRTMVVYAVTSLPHAQTSPGRLADLIRGHWVIENGLHDARDVTFAEGGSRVLTGSGPQVMACLRNLVTGALSTPPALPLRVGSRRRRLR